VSRSVTVPNVPRPADSVDDFAAVSGPSATGSLRVALVHHWLVGMRGGEKVLAALCALHPQADIYTLVCDPRRIDEPIRRHRIVTSFIQRLPFGRRHFRVYLPLFPMAAEQFDLSDYDLVISSDASVIKGVLTRPDTPHICYCHSPPRYVWDLYHTYRREGTSGVLQQRLMAPVLHYLRLYDAIAARRVTRFVANSRAVAARIARFYQCPADVIYPPVDTGFFGEARRRPEDFYLFVGHLTAYKRPALAVAACAALGRRLLVVGDGPQRRALARRRASGVQFAGWVSNERLREYYARCRALLFPGEEDFGIVPVEAQAAGVPVIAFDRGGARESVRDGETGLLFARPDVEGLTEAIRRFESQEAGFDPLRCRENARQFDRSIFLNRMRDLTGRLLRRAKMPPLPDPRSREEEG